jgi:2,3-bisphosphoglycerate-dependent phosphoglycerate mutase
MTLTHLYLIRHGETTWNSERRWQGQIDAPLSETGIAQARALGDYLRGRAITAIYSSDLSRARVTADLIGEVLGVAVQQDRRWREMNMGILQGLTHPEIVEHHNHHLEGLRDNWWDYQVEGAETRRVMLARLRAAFEEIVATAPGPEAAIVSHGGTIRVLLHHLFPDVDEALTKPIHNTSLTTLERDGDGWRLLGIAETAHLEAEKGEASGEAKAL